MAMPISSRGIIPHLPKQSGGAFLGVEIPDVIFSSGRECAAHPASVEYEIEAVGDGVVLLQGASWFEVDDQMGISLRGEDGVVAFFGFDSIVRITERVAPEKRGRWSFKVWREDGTQDIVWADRMVSGRARMISFWTDDPAGKLLGVGRCMALYNAQAVASITREDACPKVLSRSVYEAAARA